MRRLLQPPDRPMLSHPVELCHPQDAPGPGICPANIALGVHLQSSMDDGTARSQSMLTFLFAWSQVYLPHRLKHLRRHVTILRHRRSAATGCRCTSSRLRQHRLLGRRTVRLCDPCAVRQCLDTFECPLLACLALVHFAYSYCCASTNHFVPLAESDFVQAAWCLLLPRPHHVWLPHLLYSPFVPDGLHVSSCRATFYGTDAWSIHTGSCGFGFICPHRCVLRAATLPLSK